ncbi:uncharacterized protein LOC123271231 isoform X2 [Cotesia glomerata]|uniref:uncharacterized protein LOC123271231 isoform X2 n=1 Tax=Cotesia glomerata TaxID=32391 RepID=UPI001D016738|nr:uncharacterized protein LOC123271231 isoform X2 [Cotesia glomerata]
MLLGILSLFASIGIAFAQYYPTNGGLGYGQLSPGPRYQGPMYSGVPLNVMQSPNYYPGYSPAVMSNLPMPGGINPALSMPMPMPMSMPVAMGSNENSNENANTNVNVNAGSYRRSLHSPSKDSGNRNTNTNTNLNA